MTEHWQSKCDCEAVGEPGPWHWRNCPNYRASRLPPPPFASEPPNAPVTPGAGTPAKSAVSQSAGAGTAPGGDLPEDVEEAIRMHSVRCEERGILTDSGRENQAEEWKAIRERDAASATLRSAIVSALASERSRAEAAERERDEALTTAQEALDELEMRLRVPECMACGLVGTAEEVRAHVPTCAKHPLAAAHARAERMREALREIAASQSDAIGMRAIASGALASEGPTPQTPESER